MTAQNSAARAAFPARISIVTLGVSDLDRSARFYEDLGWKRSSASSPEIVWFRTADSVLGLFPSEELAADAGGDDRAVVGEELGGRSARGHHALFPIGFAADDYPDVRHRPLLTCWISEDATLRCA